jgi:hypothetical protein
MNLVISLLPSGHWQQIRPFKGARRMQNLMEKGPVRTRLNQRKVVNKFWYQCFDAISP